ncbi:hypothetical protein RKS26_02430, partial [Streptococcus pneumoniae]|nr:hypothetical protein [Streptococcus pneumoniae]
MGKHESRKNKPILLVGNGINRLFANEPEDDDSFNVEKFRGEKEAGECTQKSEMNKALRFPMRISVNYKGKEETVAQELTYFLNPNHSYLSQLDVTYKTPDLMSHFLPP